MSEEWQIGPDDTGDWSGSFPSRLEAVHAGDDEFGGAPFWVRRRVSFKEWLDLNWWPADDLDLAIQNGGCETDGVMFPNPAISVPAWESINAEVVPLVFEILKRHDSVPNVPCYTEEERVERIVGRQTTEEEART